jgi:hypothetical protein
VGLGPTHAGSRHDKACADEDGYVFPEGSTLDFIGIRSSLGYAIPFRLLRGALAC